MGLLKNIQDEKEAAQNLEKSLKAKQTKHRKNLKNRLTRKEKKRAEKEAAQNLEKSLKEKQTKHRKNLQTRLLTKKEKRNKPPRRESTRNGSSRKKIGYNLEIILKSNSNLYANK